MTNTIVCALLASSVFHRIDWLGLENHDLHRRALLLDRPTRRGHELARIARRLGGRLSLVPDLAFEIDKAISETQASGVELVKRGLLAKPEDVGHFFPSDLFGSVAKRQSATLIEVADCHLHSGASLRLLDLVRLAGSKPSPAGGPASAELVGLWSVDRGGTSYSVGALVCGLRQFVQYLNAENSGRRYARLDANVIDALVQGEFWGDIRRLALEQSGQQPAGNLMSLADISTVVETDAPAGDSVQILLAYLLRPEHEDSRHDTRLRLGLLGCLFLLDGFLKSDWGEGLPSFVDRFEQMGALRDLSSPGDRANLVRVGVDAVISDDLVVGAEFRKSVFVQRGIKNSQVEARILTYLSEHVSGFALSEAVRVAPRNLSMPVTYLRSVTHTGGRYQNSLGQELVHEIQPLWLLTSVVATLRSTYPVVSRLIPSIDVVGNELAMPNSAFIPLLAYLRSSSGGGMETSCHAGESFNWRMQGLRSIGELVWPTVVVNRIGHALALDDHVSEFISGSGPVQYHIREVLDDLCWAATTDIATTAVNRLIERLLEGAGLLRLRDFSFNDFVAAWVRRRGIDGYQALGSFGLTDVPMPPEASTLVTYGNVDLCFLLLMVRGGQYPFNCLDGTLAEGLASDYTQFREEYENSFSAYISDRIREADVVLEACPTSNLRLTGIPRAKYLPIQSWVRARNLRVSVSSDDPLIFGSNVRSELELVEAAYGDSDLTAALACESVASCGSGLGRIALEEWTRLARQLRGLAGNDF